VLTGYRRCYEVPTSMGRLVALLHAKGIARQREQVEYHARLGAIEGSGGSTR
jgi:hypothetical protein